MHELSVAQSVIEAVNSEAQRQGARSVSKIIISVGEVMQIDAGILSNILRSLLNGPLLEKAEVEVQVEAASFSCQRCGLGWGLNESRDELDAVEEELLVREPDGTELPLHFLPSLYSVFIHCPRCHSSDITLEGGRDVQLRSIVMEG